MRTDSGSGESGIDETPAFSFELKFQVLVVGASEAAIRELAGPLKGQSYKILGALSDARACRGLEQDQPDLVLLDSRAADGGAEPEPWSVRDLALQQGIPVLHVVSPGCPPSLRPATAGSLGAADTGPLEVVLTEPIPETISTTVRALILANSLQKVVQRQGDELKHLYEKWRQSKKIERNLARFVVHDLKDPLEIITSCLNGLEISLGPRASSEQAMCLVGSRQAVNRLSEMIINLLDMDKFEEGQIRLDRREIDLKPFMLEATKEYQVMGKLEGVEVVCHLAEDLPVVWVDVGLFKRVLGNLVNNAVRYATKATVVYILATDDPLRGMVTFKVRNQGAGIPAEKKRTLFEQFSQVGEEGQRQWSGGGGMGLHFCRLVVEAHGGRIWVEDAEPAGSIFAFTISRDKPSANP